MSKRKIINDPIYGLINFPFDLIYDLIDHKYFQRLRRISQMGLSNYVYPGATHTRFSHALGSLHLMTSAIDTLRNKGVEISNHEYLSTCIAILLHDIGHGPFSHALECIIVEKGHEEISTDFMIALNEQFEGQLSTAIEIFNGNYSKNFLTQLVSSQLDMDRVDYLTRDSYYSGVAEGVIGYKRIIAMLNVVDNELVVEEKGLYSIEKFLVARHIMYWQVYLHKASVCVEQMLKSYIIRLKQLLRSGNIQSNNSLLHNLLVGKSTSPSDYLKHFILIDDIDIFSEIKHRHNHNDLVLNKLGQAILERDLFRIVLSKDPLSKGFISSVHNEVKNKYNLSDTFVEDIIIQGEETTRAYDIVNDQIKILTKSGAIKPVSELMDIQLNPKKVTKYFICYPK